MKKSGIVRLGRFAVERMGYIKSHFAGAVHRDYHIENNAGGFKRLTGSGCPTNPGCATEQDVTEERFSIDCRPCLDKGDASSLVASLFPLGV